MNLRDKLGVLIGTRQLLDDPKHWVKGQYAGIRREDYVELVDFNNAAADCYCLAGAFTKVAAINGLVELNHSGWETAISLRPDMIEIVGCINGDVPTPVGYDALDVITAFNDGMQTTHADVLKVLDCAIDAVKATVGEQ